MLIADIDTSIVALPALEAEELSVHDYIESLLEWRRLIDEPWISVYLSGNSPESLFDEDIYPLRDALAELFRRKGIVEYDAHTVAVAADRLLALTPSFETFFQIIDVLCDEIETDPPVIGLAVREGLADDLARFAVLIAIVNEYCQDLNDSHYLILNKAPEQGLVHVKAVIHDLEHDRSDIINLPTPPTAFSASVHTCKSFHELLCNLDETVIWQAAIDEAANDLAVKVALYKSRSARGLNVIWDDLPDVCFGAGFLRRESIVRRGAGPDLIPRMLSSIIETIDGLSLDKMHALRTSPSGGAPQRIRASDGAKGCRRDIDREYHLHYWECSDGSRVIGWIGPHNDFDLPE